MEASDSSPRKSKRLLTFITGLVAFFAGTASVAVLARAAVVQPADAIIKSQPPPLPASFYGTVTLQDQNVTAGTLVSAWINGTKYAEAPAFLVDTNSVYRLDVPGDIPNTPEVEGGREGDTIVFKVAGFTAGQTAVWSSGTFSELNLTVSGPLEPLARFSVGKGMNVAQLEDGASIVDFSSVQSSFFKPENAIDNSALTYWITGNGQFANQWIKVALAGGGPHVVDRVVLNGVSNTQGVKEFEIRVSTTGSDDADFTTVFSGTVPQDNEVHEFAFTPVHAQYVQLFIHNNWAGSGSIQVPHFQIWTHDRQGGIVSLREGPPSSIVGFSSHSSASTAAENAIDEDVNTAWVSASGQTTNQWIKVQLGGGLTYTVDRVRIHSSFAPQGARDFEIRVSTTTADDAAFTTIFSGTAAATTDLQEFSLAAPVQARYVQLFIHNNQGITCCIRVNSFQVLTSDGANVARLEGVGAFVLGATGHFHPTTRPEMAIDFDRNTRWVTASGQISNQWLKVRLIEGAPFLINKVKFEAPSGAASPREFEIRVSTTGLDDNDFVTVLQATLPKDGLAHWFSFPATKAKYVQLFIPNNHGDANFIQVEDFQVYSLELGGDTVPFDDFSEDFDGTVTSWSWDFGDGGTSTEQHPVHTYAAPGNYPVSLSVTDNDGRTGTTIVDYTVLIPPVADFTWSPIVPNEGQITNFMGSATDADGSVVGWRWQFSHTPIERFTQNTSTTFFDNGEFQVSLTVTDSQLLMTAVTETVTVLNVAPTVNAGRDRAVLSGQTINFSPTISDPGRDTHTCLWDFGDGSPTSTICSSNHTYPTVAIGEPSQVYTATLTVSDDDGGVGSDSLRITIGAQYDVLILDTTVRAGVNSEESWQAQALGLVPKLVDAASWATMTTADFAGYRAIILGDPIPLGCGEGWRSGIAPAEANISVWGPAITGNVLLMGTDPARHADKGGYKLINRGIAFTADEPGKTGAFIALNCYYHFSPTGTPVPLLDAFQPGGFTVRGFDGSNDAHIVATHPALRDLTDADLSNWNFSIHEGFEQWPDDFLVLAIVRGIGDDYTAPDGTTGIPYILARGQGLEVLSDIRLAPATATRLVGSSHTLTATVVISATPIASTPVTFTVVSGPHAGITGTATTDSSGIATFTYTGDETGTDAIEARFVDPDGRTQTSNRATVTWALALADLAVAKDDGRAAVSAGETLTYTLAVTNAGLRQATGILLTDTLPANTTFLAASDGGSSAGGRVTWPAFSLAAGASVTRTLTARVDSSLPAAVETITNTVTVIDDGSHGPDATPTNNTATDTDTIVLPDLIVKLVDRSHVTGDWQTLHISGTVAAEIANQGDAPAVGEFNVTFFEDTNGNAIYDTGVDTVLASVVQSGLAASETMTVTSPISGTVAFRDNLIYAFVDSSAAIAESNEANNYSNTGLACEFRPPPGSFNPVLEWAWTSSTVLPDALNVMMAPAVIDLNGDGVPDVVFGSTSNTSGIPFQTGPLRAVSGHNGVEMFSVISPPQFVMALSQVAVGDIDLDGLPEIVAAHGSGNRLIAFEHDGAFKWLSPILENVGLGGPALADLDGDGTPEIVVGRQTLNSDGSLRWTGTGGRGNIAFGPLSLVADIDLDGSPDVIAGNTVYDASGGILWQAPLGDGFNAVANFDNDPFPEIVLVTNSAVRLLENDGTVKWGPVSLPGGGRGGPPTVADYDGDGQVEIGVAGASRYVVFETDGTIKWTAIIQDGSSNVTGSSVFDFEGDGSAEVVYHDERKLFVFRGTDGAVLFQTASSSCTAYEYPLVADVDGDGNAEIVAVANNNCGFGPQRGVFVFGDANDSWVGTRQIWNQHTYHITNINDDGTIPAVEANNWQTFNNYRQNLQTVGSVFAAPDLTASYLRIEPDTGTVTITARIGNGGAVQVRPGIPVAFYDGNPATGGVLLGTVQTTKLLKPGEFEDLSFSWSAPSFGVHDIYVVADDDGAGSGTQNECDETNNVHHLLVNLNFAPDLVIAKDDGQTTVLPSQILTYTLTIDNVGNRDATGVVITDTLPAYTTFLAASDGGSALGSAVTWPALDLAAGAGVTRTLTVQVADPLPAGVDTITNTVTVADDGANGPDPTPENNTASDIDALAAAPDLSLAKDDGRTTVLPSQTLTYTLTLHNDGGGDAAGVAITDTLPVSTSFVAASHGGSASGGRVTWPAFDLAAGASVTRTLTILVDNSIPAGVDVITNTATVADDGSRGPDPNLSNNTALDADILDAAPDLTITKDDGQSIVQPGATLTYTMAVRNQGTQGATGVVITDTVPANTVFNAAANTPGWDCADASPSGTVCSFPIGDLAVRANRIVEFAVTVDAQLPLDLLGITNSAQVGDDSSNGPDLNPADNIASVSTPLNHPPEAADDSFTVLEDSTNNLLNVLANDADPDGDPLTVVSVTQPSNGTASINPDNTISYAPAPDFNGTDTFQYTIADSHGLTATASVTINVLPVNDPPLAEDDEATTPEDTPVSVAVLANDSDIDGDALTVDSITQPLNGVAILNPDSTITYTPNPDFNGSDSFTYTISDGNGGTDTATVTVTVQPVNDPPVAVDDEATTEENSAVTIDVLANDSGVDGDTLSVISVSQPISGTALINPDNTITYTPQVDFSGVDTFTYTIDDGNGGTDTATVTVTVTPAPAVACELYPIALHADTLAGVAEGNLVEDIFNGAQPGNFGWLTWTGNNSIPTLVTSLTPPGDSGTYSNPNDPNDHIVSTGDWVRGRPGVANTVLVRDALDALKTTDIIVPVWDVAEGSGANAAYRVVAFALVRIVDYELPGENRISVRFLGYSSCDGNPQLRFAD